MNVLSGYLSSERPAGCQSKKACQSIEDINEFFYKEEWSDLDSLLRYLQSSNFKAFNGGINVLAESSEMHVKENTELKELNRYVTN